MKHSNVSLLEKLYSDFSNGDMAAVLNACSDQMTFQVPGKSKLAGKYSKENFVKEFVMKLGEMSSGSLKLDVHDILASDQHAVVLLTDRLMKSGKPIEYRTVHVWRFENGKPVAWYEYPRDLYFYDQVWS